MIVYVLLAYLSAVFLAVMAMSIETGLGAFLFGLLLLGSGVSILLLSRRLRRERRDAQQESERLRQAPQPPNLGMAKKYPHRRIPTPPPTRPARTRVESGHIEAI